MNLQLRFIFLSSFLVLKVVSTCTSCEVLEPCPTFWTAYKNHCYRFFGKARTWAGAESECCLFGAPNGLGVAHLLTLHSAQEEEFIFDFGETILKEDGAIWLGFHDTGKEGTFEWVDGERAVYTNWRKNEPNNAGNGEDCAALYLKEKKWNDVPCSKSTVTSPYICKMRRVREV